MSNESTDIRLQDLWAKYEDIAMHFNDLLIKLRTQSLAAVAAVSALVGLFAGDGNSNLSIGWLVATLLFSSMSIIWIAIFCLDFFYYNRLLSGAVAAIVELEKPGESESAPLKIRFSTLIEDRFTAGTGSAPKGVLLFYGIVFAFLIAAAGFSLRMHFIETKQRSSTAAAAAAQPSPTIKSHTQ